MKFKKSLSLLLASVLVMGTASFAASAAVDDDSVGAYSNQNYLESQASAAYNTPDLGCTYSPSSTTFKTWSPDASSVKVKLYKTGSDSEAGSGVIGEYPMTKDSSTGIWSYTLSGDHKDQYYTYIVNVKGQTNETQDVYSKAVGVNGNRSMVVDLDSTDPAGWDSDKHVVFQNAGEAVVWEVHVRDFSVAENSGVSSENRGKYLAFTEGGTTLNGQAGEISTGIDYLVEQGINCVQLMPVYDFQSVDESIPSSSTNRNWGYDPQNYNVPEGSYSSNPFDGNVRITEFKQMVQALHDRGISVVMDVVYNHTFNLASPLEKTAPKYYYRMSGGTYSNGSGCGNETASDKRMYRKYMIDSVKYWAEEYHIDGFRFDLMGLHDVTTMNEIRSTLDGLGSDGSKILMYGEPWTGGTTLNPDPIYSWQGTGISRLNARVGAFGDQYRDAIKGDTDGIGKGFVQGNTSDNTGNIVLGVQGQPYKATAPKGPAQAISYADAHDNLIMWDKIVKSNGGSDYTGTNANYQRQMKEIYTLLLTSQGIPFMTAGSEFGRTKKGDHNSYKSSDSINQIDWNRVKQMSGLASYYKGLLQIRKNYTPLHSSAIIKPSFQSNYGDVVAYTYTNTKAAEWKYLAVLVNGGSQAYSINLPTSNWTIVASTDGGAGLKSLGTVSGSSVSVPAKGSLVLTDTGNFNNLGVTESFGTLTINHVTDSGTVLKTQTAKYREGSTYRAYPDSSILYDYELVRTEGETTGTVAANGSYTVTFVYKNSGVGSGYVTASYVDQSGKSLKDDYKVRFKEGESYSFTAPEIQGYQLDTSKFPAKTSGTFSGDVTLKFVYKPLENTQSVVHWNNTKGWSSVRCYAYYTDGATTVEPNGKWASAPIMTSDSSMGGKWLTSTVKAPMSRVMFHTTSAQEPGQGEDGYLVAGEAWIDGGVVSFSTKIITSHIDAATGQKLADDVVVTTDKVKSTETYTTQPLAGRSDVVVPANATGNYSPGVINVVYLYTGSEPQPTTAAPEPTTTAPQPTTAAPEPTTTAPQPTTVTPEPTTEPGPGKRILIGDVDFDGKINVVDATEIQKIAAELSVPTAQQKIAGDVDGNGVVTVVDATYVQKYAASLPDTANVGKYTDDPTQPTVAPEPTTAAPEPTTAAPEPTTAAPEPTTAAPEPTTEAPEPTTVPEPENVFYLDPTATMNGQEVWWAYTWTEGPSDEEWIEGADEGGTWKFDGVTNTNVIFIRMDAEKSAPSWGGKWNQTDDLMVTLGGTYVTSGWGSGWGANLEGFWA
nr:type I pullulanase [uncultured Ruminococcus sp.]